VNRTVVFFHAHPDDEALLTGGTIARLADEGHRVVLVLATEGEAGLASTDFSGGGLGERRRQELGRSAEILGCSRVEILGFADSGMDGSRSCDAFCRLPPQVPAARLAAILADEGATVLVGYDPAGGYGHPDHIQVHRVGRIAARSAEVPVLLEATVDRRSLQRALRAIALFRPRSADFDPARFQHLFADPASITHAVNVRGFATRKRAALEAHASQGSADGAERTIAWLLRLPAPLFRLALGTEWFTEVGRDPGTNRLDDLLASLRPGC
jgi:LmbE family N-acetylglucosaminyl deacetylase